MEILNYKNKNLPVKERVADLLSRMTIDEKVYQLMGYWNGGLEDYTDDFLNDNEKMQATFGNGINSIHPAFLGLKDTINLRNKVQKYLIEKTRLGIPVVFVDEGQHGLMRPESTCFPQAIGLSCSWDINLLEEIYTVVAHEMRSRGTHHALTPVIDVCREPRWGRVEETYGEDPYLNGLFGCAAVKGLQGSDNGTIKENNVAATLKHLVGHGQSEGGQNQGPANYSTRVFRESHIPPFKMCIDLAKPASVMPSYNEVDGIPSHANSWLLNDLLRDEWKFQGMIVSDYFAIDQLLLKHCIANDAKEAAQIAFNSGVQYEFPQANYYKHLPELLEEGKIKINDIDKAVGQILELKFKLGLFENPYTDLDNAIATSKKIEHKNLALKAANESIVLLKNDGLLPLQIDKYKKIAIIGPCAKDTFFGGYAGEPYFTVSLFEGIKNKVGDKAELLFAQGCRLTINAKSSHLNWKIDEIEFAQAEENYKLISEAVEVAKQAEIVILALGENEHLCREAWAKTHIGDNNTLDLICQQNDLVKAIDSTGKPIVVYLMNGRPLSINYIVENIPAIIEGWYMGQETGNAASDIIFGNINPSGKLTITFPKSVGQLPMYYNHKPSAQYHNYLSQDIEPLFPFGFGLSYTNFEYSNLKLSNDSMKKDDSIIASVDIMNTGKFKGDEIVQLYIRDKVSSVTRPVKELKDFSRITLNPNETKNVQFIIEKSKLVFYDINMNYTVEPGEFEIMVGKSSKEFISAIFTVIE